MYKNPVMQKQKKHIDMNTILLSQLPTEFMEADLLTKALSKAKAEQHRQTLTGCSLTLDKANSASVGVLRSDHLKVRQIN